MSNEVEFARLDVVSNALRDDLSGFPVLRVYWLTGSFARGESDSDHAMSFPAWLMVPLWGHVVIDNKVLVFSFMRGGRRNGA